MKNQQSALRERLLSFNPKRTAKLKKISPIAFFNFAIGDLLFSFIYLLFSDLLAL